MPNEAVVSRKADARRELINKIDNCKATEIFRKETSEYLSTTGKVEGKRARRRQRMTFMNSISR